MALDITDFSHSNYAYTTDGGVASMVSMRNVYSACSGLTAATTALPKFLAKHARRRYISTSADEGANGFGHRHYPIAITGVANPIAPGTIDGLAWVLKGYRGEQQRA
jgi:hypothetical protein